MIFWTISRHDRRSFFIFSLFATPPQQISYHPFAHTPFTNSHAHISFFIFCESEALSNTHRFWLLLLSFSVYVCFPHVSHSFHRILHYFTTIFVMNFYVHFSKTTRQIHYRSCEPVPPFRILVRTA